MTPALGAQLVSAYGLSSWQVIQLEAVLGVLEQDDHAPTAVRTGQQAIDVHLADSLTALAVDALPAAARIADLGAGAGFTGLPLAVALPEADFWLVESQRRKCEFVERTCAVAGIENVHLVCARAEEWREGALANDAVLARALAGQAVVLEYAAPLLRLGGTLVDWRGKRDTEEEQVALRAAGELGLERIEVRRVEPFAAARDHHLHVFAKVTATPQRFPRRAGMARKRPLGS
jgi:16S rRNA (guanine527-N7)-methyltransferase